MKEAESTYSVAACRFKPIRRYVTETALNFGANTAFSSRNWSASTISSEFGGELGVRTVSSLAAIDNDKFSELALDLIKKSFLRVGACSSDIFAIQSRGSYAGFEEPEIVIRDSYGYGQTRALYLKRKAHLDTFVNSKPADANKEWEDRRGLLQYDLDKLDEELREYERLAGGQATLPELVDFDDIGEALVKWQIAKGWTTEEIAERTGIDNVVIVSYKARAYRIAPLEHLIKVRHLLLGQTPQRRFDYYQQALDEALKCEADFSAPGTDS